MEQPISQFVNRILLGDCVTVMGQMPPASVDFIATDPPYLCRFQSRDGRTVVNDDRDDWLMPAFTQMYRVLLTRA
jgi:DNA modification methylase